MASENQMISFRRADRRWRWVAYLSLGALACTALLGTRAQDQDVQVAREFRLVDAEGRLRATLGFGETGGPGITFFDRTGQPRAMLMLHDGQVLGPGDDGVASMLWLSGANAEPAVRIGAGSNARMLEINDFQGNPRIGLKVGQHGAAFLTRTSLRFLDSTGKERLILGTVPMSVARPADRQQARGDQLVMKSSPLLGLFDADGNVRAQVKVWGDGEPSLDLWDAEGAALFSLPNVGSGGESAVHPENSIGRCDLHCTKGYLESDVVPAENTIPKGNPDAGMGHVEF